MTSSNAHNKLMKSLRNEQPRASVFGNNASIGPIKSETLELVNEKALRHAHESSKKKPKAHFFADEKFDKVLHGMSPEDARELAYQAREQMTFLTDVNSRVQRALDKTKDLFAVQEMPSESDPKFWVENSRRMLNRKMFLYNESCEERQKHLTGFCEWFELYENIWPLPLVGSEAQYGSFLGKAVPKEKDVSEDAPLDSVWPQMMKMREDLSNIMSASTRMGQQALGLELRKELQRMNDVIRDLQDQMDIANKRVEQERKAGIQKDAELVKNRHIHETVLNSRIAEIERLAEDKIKLREEIDKMSALNDQLADSIQQSLDTQAAKHQNELKAIQDFHGANLQDLANNYEVKLQSCGETIENLEHRIEDLIKTQRRKDLQLQEKAQQITALSGNVSGLQQEVIAFENKLNQAQDELKAERENPLVKILESQRSELEREMKALQAKVQEQDVSLSVLRKSTASIEEVMNSKNKRIAEVEKEIITLNKALEDKANEYETLLATSNSQAEELMALTESANAERDQMAKQKSELSQQLESKAKEAKALSEQLQISADGFANLEKKSHKLQVQNNEFKLRLDEETTKHNQTLSYLQALQLEVIEQRASFTKDIEELSNKHQIVLNRLEREVKELRDYKATPNSEPFANAETQTELEEFLQSEQLATIAQIESAAIQRIVKRFMILRDKVTVVRANFEREVSLLKESVRRALKNKEIPLLHTSRISEIETETEVHEIDRFFDISVTTMIELERILAGVDSFLVEPPLRTPVAPVQPSLTLGDLEPLLALAARKTDLPLVENNFDFSKIHRLQPLSGTSRNSGLLPNQPAKDIKLKYFPIVHIENGPDDRKLKVSGALAKLESGEASKTKGAELSKFGGASTKSGGGELSSQDAMIEHHSRLAAVNNYTITSSAYGPSSVKEVLLKDSTQFSYGLSSSDYIGEQEVIDNILRHEHIPGESLTVDGPNFARRSSSAMSPIRTTESRLSNNATRPHSRFQGSPSQPSSRPSTIPDTQTSHQLLRGWGGLKDDTKQLYSDSAAFEIPLSPESKLQQAKIGELWYQGFRSGKALRILTDQDSEGRPQSADQAQPHPATTVEIINLIHTVEPLPSLPLTAGLKRLEDLRRKQEGTLNLHELPGPVSENAWLKIQGMKPSTRVKSYTAPKPSNDTFE